MSFTDFLFQLFISPLQLIYEFVFFYARDFTNSIGVTIIALSLTVNFMLLPLYRQADAIQDKERAKEKEMEHWVRHIKKTFSGNERFLMLQTYYRQNHYKPYYVLRGMMPLLLEIPFFIAAYHFLADLPDLQTSFGPIQNLSVPDGLLTIGDFSINILPIIMTLLNLISCAIYTKGLRFKDKFQLYGMAVLFLILLYNSPSGLVFYWTINNLFSLIKNFIVKSRHPRRAANITMSLLGVAAAVWAFVMPKNSFSECFPMIDVALFFQLPLLLTLLKPRLDAVKSRMKERTPHFRLFFSGCLCMTLLTGVVIPASVIASSPIEFVSFANFHTPLIHVLYSFLMAAGMFLVWFNLLYYLSGQRLRCWLDGIIWIMAVISLINYLFFCTNMGTLTADLIYVKLFEFDLIEKIINTAVVIAALVILILLWKKSKKAVQTVYVILGIVMVGMSCVYIVQIKNKEGEIYTAYESTQKAYQDADAAEGKIIRLSQNHKNVIVLMLDRAISSYIPYLFAEKPELKEQFAGFTYYPDTISFGGSTNFGSPALYGGYDYMPTEINARSSEKLVDKHDEALKVMPHLFDENNFDVTVIEPTYAGYSWIPNLRIYDDYPDIRAFCIEQGQMRPYLDVKGVMDQTTLWKRNFFCYSLMRSAPCLMQVWLYQDGSYHHTGHIGKYASDGSNLSKSNALQSTFVNSYSVLIGLPSITVTKDTENDTFLMMSNSTTHEPQLLKEPEYMPVVPVDNTQYDQTHQDRFTYEGRTMKVTTPQHMQHYHVNMAALLSLGKWFDWMRQNGVYDNTRIIIVADHGGAQQCQFDDLILEEDHLDVLNYNPLLMVKDFNSKEFTTDHTFMTNADTPSLAMEGLIKNPVNPFTNNPINSQPKEGELYITSSTDWSTDINNGNTFLPAQWYSVHSSLFDLNNWTKRDFQ